MTHSIENISRLATSHRTILLSLRRIIIYFLFSCVFFFGAVKSNAQIVINELGIGATSGDQGGGGEFVELFNKSGCTIDIGCYVLAYSGTSLGSAGWSVTIPNGTLLTSGQYYLIGGHNSNLLFSSSWTNGTKGNANTWINTHGSNGKDSRQTSDSS